MSVTENKKVLRYWIEEGYNEQNWDLIYEIYDSNFVAHVSEKAIGLEAYKQMIIEDYKPFPGKIHIEDQIAEGDMVVTKWTFRGTHTGEWKGISPTHKEVTLPGVSFNKVRNGKIVEEWGVYDSTNLHLQLGILSFPGENPE